MVVRANATALWPLCDTHRQAYAVDDGQCKGGRVQGHYKAGVQLGVAGQDSIQRGHWEAMERGERGRGTWARRASHVEVACTRAGAGSGMLRGWCDGDDGRRTEGGPGKGRVRAAAWRDPGKGRVRAAAWGGDEDDDEGCRRLPGMATSLPRAGNVSLAPA
jgi:hypothetical protein